MQIKTDTHIHTVTSVHAIPTVEECAAAAKAAGLDAIAITDHCSHKMSQYDESVNVLLAQNIPPVINGVRLMRGTEIDLVDYKGHLSFYNIPYDSEKTALDRLCEKCDIVIASPHFPAEDREGSYEERTNMFLGAIADRRVTTIGHPERTWGDYDMTALAIAAAQNHTFIELNATSLERNYRDKIREQLLLCKRFSCPIIVNSDAHDARIIGNYGKVYTLLSEIEFPVSLVANLDYNKLKKELKIQKELKGR